jgi:hypothetical protein
MYLIDIYVITEVVSEENEIFARPVFAKYVLLQFKRALLVTLA